MLARDQVRSEDLRQKGMSSGEVAITVRFRVRVVGTCRYENPQARGNGALPSAISKDPC